MFDTEPTPSIAISFSKNKCEYCVRKRNICSVTCKGAVSPLFFWSSRDPAEYKLLIWNVSKAVTIKFNVITITICLLQETTQNVRIRPLLLFRGSQQKGFRLPRGRFRLFGTRYSRQCLPRVQRVYFRLWTNG